MNEKVNKENALKFISEFSYFRLLYNEPRGEIGDLIHKIGGDIKANFDRSKYRKLINKLCSEKKKFLSRREVIVFSMGAYAECRGFDVKKIKYIGLNDAVSLRGEDLLKGYSSQHLKQANKDFPNIIYLALLRDPRAQFASTRHQMINEFGNNYNLKMGNWWSSLENLIFNRISLDDGPAHFCLLYQVAAFKALVSIWRESQAKWLFVKNEDINTKFLPTMTALCNKLSINPDQAWVRDGDEFKPTMLGQPWAGTGAYSSRYQNIKNGPLENDPQKTILKAIGPNSYVIRRWKSRLPTAEKYLLEKFFNWKLNYFPIQFF